jgi:GntR family transcriptional regulator, arabinose operon transcriptional repressor
MRERKPKHQEIFDFAHEAIVSGRYADGDRIPTEAEFSTRFSASRPTVARAIKELERMGLVERRAGAGTFVRRAAAREGALFGLLIPGLGEIEIFDPIARQIARELQARGHTALLGDSSESPERLAERYAERNVAGVFFAPLELTPKKDVVNRRVLDLLDRAGIPVVLLDRDIVPYPARSRYDLVSIDHRRAAFLLGQHLLDLGMSRVDFAARPLSATTVALRVAGYQEALLARDIQPRREWIHWGDPEDVEFARRLVDKKGPRAVICANDVTAAQLMHSLDTLGAKVPEQVRVVGFDDVRYSKLLRVPLTTVRQPLADLGTVATQAMLERREKPALPGRLILLHAPLVVRTSCGAGLQ